MDSHRFNSVCLNCWIDLNGRPTERDKSETPFDLAS
jgi:hypothetical protein